MCLSHFRCEHAYDMPQFGEQPFLWRGNRTKLMFRTFDFSSGRAGSAHKQSMTLRRFFLVSLSGNSQTNSVFSMKLFLFMYYHFFSFSVFSPSQRRRRIGRVSLGEAQYHIKAFGPAPFPHQRKVSAIDILGQYPFSRPGRTVLLLHIVLANNLP